MWKEVTTIRQLSQAACLRQVQPRHTFVSPALARRAFITIPPRQAQPQDEEDHYHDRRTLKPQRTETSQSATTDEVASQDAAFDPSKTSPESQMGASKEETKKRGYSRDPLSVSAADKDVSSARDPMEGGAQKNVDKAGHSGKGWARKNKETKAGRK